MDRRGGCCIARYAGGAYDIAKLDKIMLRFRPIAPKPASGSVSGGENCSSVRQNCSSPSGKSGRGKRRQEGAKKRRRCSPENTSSAESVTLPLLPQTPAYAEAASEAAEKRRFPMWLSFENGPQPQPPSAAAVASWVKVECVTDTWQAGGYPYGVMGRTDEERVRSLEADTCPGFVSDGSNRVTWTNAAYRRMVAGGGEVAAWLVVEEGVALPPPVGCAAFTCRVRVITCGSEKEAAKTVPCDVWRMDCGGFAWRLDTAAALSLWSGN